MHAWRGGRTPRADRRDRSARSARSAGPASRPARRGRRPRAPPRSPARRSSASARPNVGDGGAAPVLFRGHREEIGQIHRRLSPSASRPRGVARGLPPGRLARGETRADHASRSERLVRRAHAPARDEQVVHVARLERAERNVVRLPVRRDTRTDAPTCPSCHSSMGQLARATPSSNVRADTTSSRVS